MGKGRLWIEVGAGLFALNLAWIGWIYVVRAWPTYIPFFGMAAGGILVVVGLFIAMLGGSPAEHGAANDPTRPSAPEFPNCQGGPGS
jgi:hypothetical protein